MKFCPECGGDLKGSTKFCPGCGINVGQLLKKEIIIENNAPKESIFDVTEEPIVEKSTRELGSNLEDMVEKILENRGFSTTVRTKIRGSSGQLNEIDIMAKRNRITIAVECKNYAEAKIGIKEIRDFSAKLDDLDIKKGLFITSSDFSSDAIGWATNNPQLRQIELWNGDKLTENFQAAILGRSGIQSIKVSDCLNIRDTIENYSEILLKNKNNVSIARREMSFYPYYIVQFTLRDQFKTPDRQIHSKFNSGQYVVDGLTRSVLYCADDNGNKLYDKEKEQKQIIEDIMSIEPHKTVEVKKASNSNLVIHKASMSKNDVEFSVRKKVIEDNKSKIPYHVRKSKAEEIEKKYTHVPNPSSIQLQSKIIFVPKLEIIFDSKEYTYKRRILPASDITLVDEISECKHLLRKKHTFAVCEICGIAKCESDIFIDRQNMCYCKKHASQELKESKKNKSIKDRLSFSFKKKP